MPNMHLKKLAVLLKTGTKNKEEYKILKKQDI